MAVTDRAAEQGQLLPDVLEEQTTRVGKASDAAGVQAGRSSREKVIILFNWLPSSRGAVYDGVSKHQDR